MISRLIQHLTTSLLLLLLAMGSHAADDSPTIVQPDKLATGFDISRQLRFVEDGAGKWSVEEADRQAPAFQAFNGKAGGGTSTRQRVFWFRFLLSNPTAEDINLILEIPNPDIERVDIYQASQQGWVSQQLGTHSTQALSFGNALPVARLHLPANSSQIYYLRAYDLRIDTFPVQLRSEAGYLQYQHWLKLASGLGMGLLAGLCIFHLLNGMRQGGFSNWLMAGLCLATVAATGARNNDFHLLTAENSLLATLFRVGAPLLAITFHALVSQQIFDTARRHQNTHRLLGFYAAYSAAWAVGVTAGIPEALMLTLMTPIIFIASLIFIRLAWNRMHQGYTPAIPYLVGTLLLTVVGSLLIVLSTGLSQRVDLLQPIGSVLIGFAILALTMAISHREQYLRSQARAETQNNAHEKAVGSIKAMMSTTLGHAVRAPMSDCLGLAQMMRSQPIPAGLNAALVQIEQTGTGLLTLLDDVIDTRRQREGSSQLEREDTELPVFLTALLNSLASGASLNNQELALLLSPDVPPQCKLDRQRLQEVLLELLNHALSQGVPGITLRCQVEEIRAGSVLLQFQVELFGANDASSMAQPSDRCARLLDEMGGVWRDRNKTPTQYGFTLPCPVGFPPSSGDAMALQGTRVGLAGGSHFIRHAIAEQLALWGVNTVSEDALRRGERAHMLFIVAPPLDEESLSRLIEHYRAAPLAPRNIILMCSDIKFSAHQAPGFRLTPKPIDLSSLQSSIRAAQRIEVVTETVSNSAAPESTLNLRVLLAEDDPTAQIVTQGLLRQLGASVKTCPDGVSALEELVAHTQDYDCALLSANMPIMDGLRCAREIRAREASQGSPRLPLLLLSAGSIEHSRARAAGIDAVLEKPVLSAELGRQLQKICLPNANAI